MNNRFYPPHSQYHESSPLLSPGYPSVATAQQGDFGYSDPRRYRSDTLGTLGHARSFPSCCPTVGQSPLLGFPPCPVQPPSLGISPYLTHSPLRGNSPYGYFQPRFQPAAPEHIANFTRKDSYWSTLPPTTISGVRRKVARTFVSLRSEHRQAKRVALRERPFTMSSSTALLPKDPNAKRGDQHPIFLRVCHSPWLFIGQKVLVFLRGITATYLLVSFLMIIQYDLQANKHDWLTAFELPNVVYLLQIIYAWIAFMWTAMHLYYPHHGNQIQTGSTRLQKIFSPPRQNPTTKNRTFFSIFYTAAVTYPLVVTFIHWAILVSMHKETIPTKEIFSKGWYTEFFIFNKYGINSVIALIEILVYSSIRRQDPVAVHIFGLSIFSLFYVGWASLGYVVTDKYHYFFFDHKQVGWEHVGLAVAGFVAVTNIFFLVVYGLTGIREKLTRRGEDRKSGGGYTRLPQ